MNSANTITVGQLWQATLGWMKEPFTSQMDLWRWFLGVGVIIVFALIWLTFLKSYVE